MLIAVRVTAAARAEKVVRESDSRFAISVREKAERNMANRGVLEIIRKQYPGMKVRIVSGHRSPTKILEVE